MEDFQWLTYSALHYTNISGHISSKCTRSLKIHSMTIFLQPSKTQNFGLPLLAVIVITKTLFTSLTIKSNSPVVTETRAHAEAYSLAIIATSFYNGKLIFAKRHHDCGAIEGVLPPATV